MENIGILNTVLQAAGFPEAFISEIAGKIKKNEPGSFIELFATTVNRRKITGHVRIDVDETNGNYRLRAYKLWLPKASKAPIQRCIFRCQPWYLVSIHEAVNLMEGRYVYRRPELDFAGSGYWFRLDNKRDHNFEYIRNDFSVQAVVNETRIASWLGLDGWKQLISRLERGDRCDLSIGTGDGMRAVIVEADPLGQCLKLTDKQGRELDIELLMNRRSHVESN